MVVMAFRISQGYTSDVYGTLFLAIIRRLWQQQVIDLLVLKLLLR